MYSLLCSAKLLEKFVLCVLLSDEGIAFGNVWGSLIAMCQQNLYEEHLIVVELRSVCCVGCRKRKDDDQMGLGRIW